MGGKNNVLQYRARLDKALASKDLADEERLKALVKNQILRSSRSELEESIDGVIDKRSKEVSNLLSMLRSASSSDDDGSKPREAHKDWKVKQDTQEYRVMYREGPEGTPYHTLLVEGYVDGPLDVCLCISMESRLYQKWWPQSVIPTFKIVSSECLQKVRIGEQISLVRMKVPWPLSAREALVHFFVLEYFQDDLLIVLLNSISDLDSIDMSTHGFNRDGIPDAQEIVRIDAVGGIVLQKVNANRSYFRVIANMDIKLDFVPPALINFLSRQLIGSGFRLYQKEVASVSKGDEEFGKVLKEPLYTQIREGLYSDNISKIVLKPKEQESDIGTTPEDHMIKSMPAEEKILNEMVLTNDRVIDSEPEVAVDEKAPNEIEEIEEEEIKQDGHLNTDSEEMYYSPTYENVENCCISNEVKITISSEVDQALGTLEKVISIFREYGLNSNRSLPAFTDGNYPDLEKDEKGKIPVEDSQICSNGRDCLELLKGESVMKISSELRNGSYTRGSRLTTSDSHGGEATHNRIAPALPEDIIITPMEANKAASCSPMNHNHTPEAAILESTASGDKPVKSEANGNKENISSKRKSRKMRFCCLHFLSGQQTL